MMVKHVSASRYAILTSEKGPTWEVVPKLWQKIWSMTSSELGGTRTYIADFEVYDERTSDPANAVVEINLGLR